MHRLARHIPLLIILCSLLLATATMHQILVTAATGTNIVPSQWIAKIYTEALGRLPNQTGQSDWQNMVTYFQTNGCSASMLQSQGSQVFTSSEFSGLYGNDNAAKLLTLYRGALNREPDSSGFNYYLPLLNDSTRSWSSVVTEFFTGTAFNNLVPSICTTGSYSFDTYPALDICNIQNLHACDNNCPSGYTCQSTETQLSDALQNAKSGDTIYLAQKALIQLTKTLTIPLGVTLTTAGQWDPQTGQYKYALMGRLVRASSFNPNCDPKSSGDTPLVDVSSGATLQDVWVDGQRGISPDYVNYNSCLTNITIEGGSGTTVSNNRTSNTIGFSSLHAKGSGEWHTCASNTITYNVVTAYSSNHYNGQWSDGLSIACENATVKDNQVVDATDVGIVLYRAAPAIQHSLVSQNTILSAGNSAFGGLVADPLTAVDSNPDFTGSSVDHNTLWTGPNTWFDIGLGVGTRAWPIQSPNKGTGASFTNNQIGTESLTANVNAGIAVNGMLNVTVTGNTLNVNVRHVSNCPAVPVAAAISAGWASGTIQGPPIDIDFAQCVGETSWPQFRGGLDHTADNLSEHLLGPDTVGNLKPYWQTHLGGSISTSSPTVVNGIVYIGTTGGTGGHSLYALDAQTGTELWQAATGNQIYSTPAVVNGIVYVGSVDGNLYAFDARTGAQIWNQPACAGCNGGGLQSSPAVAVVNGVTTVYIGSYDGNLYAFDAQTGAQRWKAPAGGIVWSSPAVDNGVVYVGSWDGNLYAFDAQTGAQRWAAPTKDVIRSSPAVAVVNGVTTVYIGSFDGNLYAFNANDGTLLWSAPAGGGVASPAIATVAIKGKLTTAVYIGSDNENLYAFDAQTGALLWEARPGGGLTSSPTVANGVVYVGSQDHGNSEGTGNKLYALAADTGNLLWASARAADFIYSSPTVVNGAVYVGCADYNVYAYALPV